MFNPNLISDIMMHILIFFTDYIKLLLDLHFVDYLTTSQFSPETTKLYGKARSTK